MKFISSLKTSFYVMITTMISFNSAFAADVIIPSYEAFDGSTITPGASNGGSTFTIPTANPPDVQEWAGFAATESTETTFFPFVFSEAGQLTVNADVPGGGDATLRFIFQKNPYPDTDPSYTVDIPISGVRTGPDPAPYTATIPSQGDNTFSNFVFYIVEKDTPVEIVDIQVASDDPDPNAPTPGEASETTLPNTNWVPFDGSGAEKEGSLFTVPTSAQFWAGYANDDSSIYPFSFSEAGQIQFTASVPSGGSANVKFRFEKLPYPNVDPSYDTAEVTITGSTDTQYTIEIPPQGENTFQSFLFYVVTRDVGVNLGDVTVFDDAGAAAPVESGVYFKFEDVVDSNGNPAHSITTNDIEVTNTTPQSFSVTIPAYTDPNQVFKSMLFYVINRDQAVVVKDVTVQIGDTTFGGTGADSLIYRTFFGGAQEVDELSYTYGVPSGSGTQTWAGYKLGNPELSEIHGTSDGGFVFDQEATLTFTAYLSDAEVAPQPDYDGETAFSGGTIDTSVDTGTGVVADGAAPYKWSAAVTYFDVNSDDTEGGFGGNVPVWSPVSNLPATWSENNVITMAPNTSAFNTWFTTKSDGTTDGNKYLHQYLMIQGASGDALGTSELLGQTVTFTGTIEANTLDDRYEVSAFIGYVDGEATYRELDLISSGETSFSVTYDIPEGNYIPQLGFVLKGRNAAPGNTWGNVQFGNLVATYDASSTITEGTFSNGSNSYWLLFNGVDFNSDGGYGSIPGQVVMTNGGTSRSSVYTVSNEGTYETLDQFGFVAGQTYDVTYYMNRLSGDDLGLLQFVFYVPGAENEYVAVPSDNSAVIHPNATPVNGEWAQYSQEVAVPEGATYGVLYIISGAQSVIAFDQITTTQVIAQNIFANWATDNGLSGADALFNADPDNDGIPNGLENFFGTAPNAYSSVGMTNIAEATNGLSMQHSKSSSISDDVSASYEWSTDLSTWNASGTTVDGSTVTITTQDDSPSAGTTTATATVSGTDLDTVFIKVSVSNE